MKYGVRIISNSDPVEFAKQVGDAIPSNISASQLIVTYSNYVDPTTNLVIFSCLIIA